MLNDLHTVQQDSFKVNTYKVKIQLISVQRICQQPNSWQPMHRKDTLGKKCFYDVKPPKREMMIVTKITSPDYTNKDDTYSPERFLSIIKSLK